MDAVGLYGTKEARHSSTSSVGSAYFKKTVNMEKKNSVLLPDINRARFNEGSVDQKKKSFQISQAKFAKMELKLKRDSEYN